MDLPHPKRKYTEEEKMQLLANLDIEVAHRTHQFESWLADRLENFNMHQEGQVLRIPKQARNMKMREFGEKYNGNIQAALRGVQKEKLAAAGGDASFGELDRSARKRKWVASHEVTTADTNATKEPDAAKAPKVARMTPLSPMKAGPSTGPGTAQRSRLLTSKASGTVRNVSSRSTATPSPQKKPAFVSGVSTNTLRYPSRPASPSKLPHRSNPPQSRVPSSSTFNPSLPPKTPKYPNNAMNGAAVRLPRRDESLLSVNGSPLANPYEFGLGWFKGMEMAEATDEEDTIHGPREPRTIKKMKSSIKIRRDPSVALPSNLHSRTNSQVSVFSSSSQTTSSSHSRQNSQSQLTQSDAQSTLPQFPTSHSQPLPDTSHMNPLVTPKPLQRSFSALVAIPTKDGHLLEFDPLQTSPSALDALDGITDSAKKQARVEMGRLVQAAVDKWKIG